MTKYSTDEVLKVMAHMDVYRDWLSLPVPSKLDEMVNHLLSSVDHHTAYRELRRALRREHFEALAGFGYRAASWAVQTGSRDLLVRGLLALALCGLSDPDIALNVPLYGRSAYLLGISRDEVFEEAAQICGDPEAPRLREYLRIAPLETEPLESFREVRNGGRFRYEFVAS